MATKLVLVNPKVLETLSTITTDPVPDAKTESLRKLNTEITEATAQTQDPTKHPSGSATELQQMLFRFLKRYEQVKKKPALLPIDSSSSSSTASSSPPSEEDDLMLKEALNSVPKTMKKNTQLILDRIK
ncbi:hypothetical protein ACOMHN_021845 [Nucella lapillus]